MSEFWGWAIQIIIQCYLFQFLLFFSSFGNCLFLIFWDLLSQNRTFSLLCQFAVSYYHLSATEMPSPYCFPFLLLSIFRADILIQNYILVGYLEALLDPNNVNKKFWSKNIIPGSSWKHFHFSQDTNKTMVMMRMIWFAASCSFLQSVRQQCHSLL